MTTAPSIHDVFAHSVRVQMREEQQETQEELMELVRHVRAYAGKDKTLRQIADWFRSIGIPSDDAAAYVRQLEAHGLTSLLLVARTPVPRTLEILEAKV